MRFRTAVALAIFAAVVVYGIVVTHAASVGTWSRVGVRGGSPPLESNIPACSIVGHRFYVHGGRQGLYALSDSMHYFDLEEQTWVKPSIEVVGAKKAMPALYGHTMTRVKQDRLYLFGGRTGLTSFTNDIYEFNTETNTLRLISLSESAVAPTPRQGHTTVAVGDASLLVFGGRDSSAINNELWSFDTDQEKWQRIESNGAVPPALEGHTAIVKQNKMYVFGGNDGRELNSDIYILDLSTFEWRTLASKGRPRAYHTSTLIGNYIYIVAGGISNEELGDVQVFDTTTERWVRLSSPVGTLPNRQGHCAVGYKTGVYVFGGSTGWKTRFNDIHLLDTDPEATRQRQAMERQSMPKREFSAEIEETIVSINLLADVTDKKDTKGTAIEREISELIAKDKDTKEEFAGLPQKIVIWRQIGDLYEQLSLLKEGISVTKVSKQAESISRVHSDYIALKKQLVEEGKKLKEKLDGLKHQEELVTTKKRQVNEIGISMESVRNSTKRLRNEKDSLENDIVEQNKKIAGLVADIDGNRARLSVIEKELAGDGTEDREKEKELLQLLEQLNTKSANVQSEITESNSQIHKLSISVSNAERQLSRLDDLRREIEELKSKFEKTMESQNIYLSSKDSLIKRLQQSDFGKAHPAATDSDDLCAKNDAKWIEQLLRDNQATYEKQLEEKKAELAKYEAIRDTKRKEYRGLVHETDSTKKELELVQARLRNQETLHKEYASESQTLNLRISEMEKRLEEERQSLESMTIRLAKVKAEYNEVTERFSTVSADLKRAKEEEAAAERSLAGFRSELHGDYVALTQMLNQCRQQGDSLETLRSEMVSARNEYVGQREGLERTRESILKKLAEAEDVSAQLVLSLEKELLKLKKDCGIVE